MITKHSPSFWRKVGNLISVFGRFLNINTSNGNVGIGTTAPADNLDVYDATASGIYNRVSGVGANWLTTATQSQFGTYSNIPLQIKTNDTTRIYITAGGNVGIGTTTPLHKLHVNGNVQLGTAFNYSPLGSLDFIVGSPNSNSRFMFGQSNSVYGGMVWNYNSTTANTYLSIGIANTGGSTALDGINIKYNGSVGIGTTTPNAKLDVLGKTRFGDSTTNYTEFEADGTMKMVGNATVYDDVNAAIASAKTPPANFPSWTAFTANTNAYTFAINDYADLGTIEIPHSYKEGSDLEIHLHLATNGTNNATARKVKYIVYYTYGIPGDGANQFTAEASLTAELTIPANQLDKSVFYLSMGTVTGTNIKMGTQFKMRVKRIAGTGTEPANDPFLGQVGVHFQMDTIGSRTITGK